MGLPAVLTACTWLHALLYAYWLLATGSAVLALWPLPALRSFQAAVSLAASRGKTWESRPRGALGRFSDVSVPQAWFAHFYLLGACANSLVLLALLLAGSGPGRGPLGGAPALCALQLHLLRRLTESCGLLVYPPGARMHLLAYLFGLSYYAVLPLSLLRLADLQLAAAWLLGQKEAAPAPVAPPTAGVLGSGLTWGGAAVFLWGSWVQWRAHAALARLGARRTGPGAGAPARRGGEVAAAGAAGGAGAGRPYGLPRGGWFEAVSCPHYLGEVVLYVGLAALAAPAAPLPLLVLAWVATNLTLAARATHAWYRAHIPGYPRQRRALIPCLL